MSTVTREAALEAALRQILDDVMPHYGEMEFFARSIAIVHKARALLTPAPAAETTINRTLRDMLLDTSEKELIEALGPERFAALAAEGKRVVEKALASSPPPAPDTSEGVEVWNKGEWYCEANEMTQYLCNDALQIHVGLPDFFKDDEVNADFVEHLATRLRVGSV